MLNWMKRRGPITYTVREAADAQPVMSGRYLLLYEYLHNRYADTVVLTFTQIESLIGFAILAGLRGQKSPQVFAEPHVFLAEGGYLGKPPNRSRFFLSVISVKSVVLRFGFFLHFPIRVDSRAFRRTQPILEGR